MVTYDKKLNLLVVFLLLSAVFSYLLVYPYHFPFTSVSIVLACLASIGYMFKPQKKWIHHLLLGFVVSFSVFIIVRSSPVITFLNIISITYFAALMMQSSGALMSVSDIIFAPFTVFLKIAQTKNLYTLDHKDISEKIGIQWKVNIPTLASIGVTAIVLALIIPLLSTANPLFGQLVHNLLSLINVSALFQALFSDDSVLHVTRLIFFVLFALLLPRLASYMREFSIPAPGSSSVFNRLTLIPLKTPKITVAMVLGIFFITQLELYFASAETLRALNLTYSQYAREIFGQLLVVSLIIYGLVYNDEQHDFWSKLLTYILVFEAVFLSLMAFKSVYDYSSVWGFTHKRLWGYTGVIWVIGAFVIFILGYTEKIKKISVPFTTAILTGVVIVGVNSANFDYIIYHYAKTTTYSGYDYLYVSGLSSDAQAYNLLYEKIVIDGKTATDEQKFRLNLAGYTLSWKIENLQYKFKDADFRAFNFNEYSEYLRVKNINLEEFRKLIESFVPITPVTDSLKIIPLPQAEMNIPESRLP